MKVSDADHRANGEAADARGDGKLVYGFSEDPGTEDALVALCLYSPLFVWVGVRLVPRFLRAHTSLPPN